MRVSTLNRPLVRRVATAAGVAVTAIATMTVAGVQSGVQASPGSDPFVAGKVYHGDFSDPSLLAVNGRYYAFATTTGGDHIPSMTSTNLKTWRARRAYPLRSGVGSWRGYNDALPQAASYAATHVRDGNRVTGAWSPSVAVIGGRYVMAYVVQVRNTPVRRCISIATAAHPLGRYADHSRRPIVCSKDPRGSVDPQIFVKPNGHAFLIWKNAGLPGHHPTKIWTRRLDSTGTGFKTGTRGHLLLKTARRWEGKVIENPAMVQYDHHYYLFYSGNHYSTTRYATGYAICRTPLGGCHRPTRGPLLASGHGIAGPGGAVPLIDAHGVLRLGYAAWEAGHVGYPHSAACRSSAAGCNQRRLHVATLGVGRHGHLYVTDRG